MMKKLFIYILLIATSSTVAQTQLPLEAYPNGGNPDGIYFKDVNDILDAYTGTWQWTEGNKELTFYLYKDEEVTFVNPIRGTYQRDVVFGYYVYTEGGNVLIDTKPDLLADIDNRVSIDRGGVGMLTTTNGYDPETLPSFYFVDYSRRNCSNGVEHPISGDPGLWVFLNATTARVALITGGILYTTCDTTVLHASFPINQGITINKISNTAPPLD